MPRGRPVTVGPRSKEEDAARKRKAYAENTNGYREKHLALCRAYYAKKKAERATSAQEDTLSRNA